MTGAGSFEAFVAERATALLRTAYLLTGDPGRALDLLQAALVSLHRRWDRIADPAEATAVARRELVAAQTRWWHRLWLGDLLAESRLLAGTAGLPGFGPPTARPGGPAPDELTAALAGLPPRMRAVLVLRLGEGLPEADTAGALGGPVELVRTQSRLGLVRLRELLDGTGAGDGDDAALTGRLRHHVAVRAAEVTAPEDLVEFVLDGARSRRRHRAGLVALAAFLVLVPVLVLVAGALA